MREIHIHLHHHADRKLEFLERKIDVLISNTEKIIMASAAVTAVVARIDAATVCPCFGRGRQL